MVTEANFCDNSIVKFVTSNNESVDSHKFMSAMISMAEQIIAIYHRIRHCQQCRLSCKDKACLSNHRRQTTPPSLPLHPSTPLSDKGSPMWKKTPSYFPHGEMPLKALDKMSLFQNISVNFFRQLPWGIPFFGPSWALKPQI